MVLKSFHQLFAFLRALCLKQFILQRKNTPRVVEFSTECIFIRPLEELFVQNNLFQKSSIWAFRFGMYSTKILIRRETACSF